MSSDVVNRGRQADPRRDRGAQVVNLLTARLEGNMLGVSSRGALDCAERCVLLCWPARMGWCSA